MQSYCYYTTQCTAVPSSCLLYMLVSDSETREDGPLKFVAFTYMPGITWKMECESTLWFELFMRGSTLCGSPKQIVVP